MKNLVLKIQDLKSVSCFARLNVLFFFFVSLSYSQITGVIIDGDGNPVSDVRVESLNSGVLNYSASDGSFELDLSSTISLNGLTTIPASDHISLHRNPKSFQVEVHLRSKQNHIYVYDLQGSFLRMYSSKPSAHIALPKALVREDTIVFSLEGYFSDSIRVHDDATNLDTLLFRDRVKYFMDARDGHIYRWVLIGEQIWMAENLNYLAYGGSSCYHTINRNCNIYGRLYTWNVAMADAASSEETPSGVQGVCPSGWHLPSINEWELLAEYVATETGLTSNIGGRIWNHIGPKLKSSAGWNDSGNGTDDFGFSALPGGFYRGGATYEALGIGALFWSSTERISSSAYRGELLYNEDYFHLMSTNTSLGLSVRCIKDTE